MSTKRLITFGSIAPLLAASTSQAAVVRGNETNLLAGNGNGSIQWDIDGNGGAEASIASNPNSFHGTTGGTSVSNRVPLSTITPTSTYNGNVYYGTPYVVYDTTWDWVPGATYSSQWGSLRKGGNLSLRTSGGSIFNMAPGLQVNDPYGSWRGGSVALMYTGSMMNLNGFSSGSSGYIGFRFGSESDTRYGWASVTFTTGGLTGMMQINEWYYENEGNGILVGSTVPEPSQYASGLAVLALGAAGVRRWRKNRATQAG